MNGVVGTCLLRRWGDRSIGRLPGRSRLALSDESPPVWWRQRLKSS
jgi:hypothetical protein